MSPHQLAYQVAVVGASTLLGKELIGVLEERKFPIGRLMKIETAAEDPDIPILDLDAAADALLSGEELKGSEVDFAFLAGRRNPGAELPDFLADPGLPKRAVIIDLVGDSSELRPGAEDNAENWRVSAPFLDREFPVASDQPASGRLISAHPASIVLGGLLLRLHKQLSIERAVAHIFPPVSEIGPKGIEELQKQTINLLSFQKIPEAVFGTQLAFNVLPRLGRRPNGHKTGGDELLQLENRVRTELETYLAGRVRLPALRLVQVPVFYSLAVSVYLEAAVPVRPEAVARGLAGERIRVGKGSERAPSQVQVTGSSDILVDAITSDPQHPNAFWIWATADNMRLAALNAAEIAERQVQKSDQKSNQKSND